jgi:predicted transcriptional regulator
MSEMTTIQVSKKTKELLDRLKISTRETYNDVIEQLIEDGKELSDQAIKDIEEALEDYKEGRVISHDEVKRQMGF